MTLVSQRAVTMLCLGLIALIVLQNMEAHTEDDTDFPSVRKLLGEKKRLMKEIKKVKKAQIKLAKAQRKENKRALKRGLALTKDGVAVEGQNVGGDKWVFAILRNSDGSPIRVPCCTKEQKKFLKDAERIYKDEFKLAFKVRKRDAKALFEERKATIAG